jgi:hypothetical protein
VGNIRYLRKNYLYLSDDFIGLTNAKEDYFYSLSNKEYGLSPTNNGASLAGEQILYTMTLKIDSVYDTYERQVYNVGNLISDVGGFYSALFIAGTVIYS